MVQDKVYMYRSWSKEKSIQTLVMLGALRSNSRGIHPSYNTVGILIVQLFTGQVGLYILCRLYDYINFMPARL